MRRRSGIGAQPREGARSACGERQSDPLRAIPDTYLLAHNIDKCASFFP